MTKSASKKTVTVAHAPVVLPAIVPMDLACSQIEDAYITYAGHRDTFRNVCGAAIKVALGDAEDLSKELWTSLSNACALGGIRKAKSCDHASALVEFAATPRSEETTKIVRSAQSTFSVVRAALGFGSARGGGRPSADKNADKVTPAELTALREAAKANASSNADSASRADHLAIAPHVVDVVAAKDWILDVEATVWDFRQKNAKLLEGDAGMYLRDAIAAFHNAVALAVKHMDDDAVKASKLATTKPAAIDPAMFAAFTAFMASQKA